MSDTTRELCTHDSSLLYLAGRLNGAHFTICMPNTDFYTDERVLSLFSDKRKIYKVFLKTKIGKHQNISSEVHCKAVDTLP
jgi:hypothetical protein